MDQQCKISVIVPVYNTEPWLKPCLESVLLHQDLDDIEVICIDDGSTDASLQILNDFAEKDSRVKVYTQSNSGLSATRNRGVELANGEYILFLDSDDMIAENSFLYLYNEITSNDLDVLYFEAEVITDMIKCGGGNYTRKNDYSTVVTGRELFVQLIDNNDFIPSSCLYLIRNSFLKQSSIRFYEGIFHEDELFTPLLMLQAERVSCRNRKIYIRRFRENSIMTNQMNIKNVHGTLTVSIELVKKLELYKHDEETYIALEKRIGSLFNGVIARFNSLSDEEKYKVKYFTEEENKFFQLACLKAGISVQRDIKISVIVPIYNVEEYLRECLDSIVNQTLKDIEIILIDDCSNDNSGKLADEYNAKDGRITVIHKERNEGALLARKTGVARAQGKYIVFVDSDDYLTSDNSLQIIYNLIENKNVDIMQFDVDVYSDEESRIKLANYLNKHINVIYRSKDIISKCFLSREYQWVLWNKIYKSDICKKGFEYIENIYLNNATDVYTFFVVAFFAGSFESIESPHIYTYRTRETGASRKKELTISDFQLLANSKKICSLLTSFLKIVYSYYSYKNIIEKIESILLSFSISNGFCRIISNEIDRAYIWLIKDYSIADIIKNLWFTYNQKGTYLDKMQYEAELAKKLYGTKLLKTTKDEIKTIGIFYHRYNQGGIQKGISIRIPIFLKMGYQVVLFTDEYNPELEYEIPMEIKREILPKDYDNSRAEVFLKALEENKVDFILYHASSSGILLFDLLLIKSQGIPFVVFRHELAVLPVFQLSNRINSLYHIYKLADKLIVLTKMDEQYYRIMGVNAKYMQNMGNSPKIEQESYSKNEGIILWVGRLDSIQKNYIDVIKIMERVVMYNNNARLVMLGNEYSTNSANILKESIERSHLQDNVKWIGPTLDMDTWYRKAKIHLVTSSYECFPRVIMESKTYGIPLVTYSMPYLELLKDGKGYIEVPQGGIQEAADVILKLLGDNELCERLSKEAKESIKPFMEFDHESAWREIFEEVISPKADTSPADVTVDKDNMRLLMETFGFHYEKGVEKYTESVERYKNLERIVAPVRNIPSHILQYLTLCATARVDIKLSGSPQHKLTFVSCDSSIYHHTPEWFAKNGMGICLQSSTGIMDFSVQCENTGLFLLLLKGVDYRDNEGKRTQIWINYKKLTINGEDIIPGNTRCSHDNAHTFQKDVKEKDIITVHAEWFPDGYQEPPQK